MPSDLASMLNGLASTPNDLASTPNGLASTPNGFAAGKSRSFDRREGVRRGEKPLWRAAKGVRRAAERFRSEAGGSGRLPDGPVHGETLPAPRGRRAVPYRTFEIPAGPAPREVRAQNPPGVLCRP